MNAKKVKDCAPQKEVPPEPFGDALPRVGIALLDSCKFFWALHKERGIPIVELMGILDCTRQQIYELHAEQAKKVNFLSALGELVDSIQKNDE